MERLTLEQLKAMSDDGIQVLWQTSQFPFDSALCGACLTMHITMYHCTEPSEREHQTLHDSLVATGLTPGRFHAKEARPYLEELYALRLFYDHLYRQPVEIQLVEQVVESEKLLKVQPC